MQPSWDTLHAMLHCPYKAWQIARSEDEQISIHQNHHINAESRITIPVIFSLPQTNLS